ncbi:MAG: glycosyltransferase family 2 protein [Chitinophagaceae bacterium]
MNPLPFAIGIPTVCRHDLLNEAIDFYSQSLPDVTFFIANNNEQNFYPRENIHSDINILNNNRNLGVAESWNQLCKYIFFRGFDYALILNDDVILKNDQQSITKIIESNSTADFIQCSEDYAMFILPNRTYKKVGAFDKRFYPAYFEDNDYNARLIQNKCKIVVESAIEFIKFSRSMSIKMKPELNNNFEQNKRKYIEKWGGEPGKEKIIITI